MEDWVQTALASLPGNLCANYEELIESMSQGTRDWLTRGRDETYAVPLSQAMYI